MRLAILTLACIALAACNRQDTRTQPTARQAGREAYQATRDLKKDAKKAAEQLRAAGKQFQQGWQEQKHADHNAPPPDHTRTNQPRR